MTSCSPLLSRHSFIKVFQNKRAIGLIVLQGFLLLVSAKVRLLAFPFFLSVVRCLASTTPTVAALTVTLYLIVQINHRKWLLILLLLLSLSPCR